MIPISPDRVPLRDKLLPVITRLIVQSDQETGRRPRAESDAYTAVCVLDLTITEAMTNEWTYYAHVATERASRDLVVLSQRDRLPSGLAGYIEIQASGDVYEHRQHLTQRRWVGQRRWLTRAVPELVVRTADLSRYHAQRDLDAGNDEWHDYRPGDYRSA